MKNSIKTSNYIIGDKRKRKRSEKQSFLSHISHGIRTPLNSIMGFSKLLNSRSHLDSKQKEYINGILSGSNLLLQFVDNVMDLSQFESNNYSLNIKKYDLNKILWEFTEEFYSQQIDNDSNDISLMLVWEKRHQDFEIETDACLIKKVLQRMLNIVSAKYSTVDLELGYRRINGSSVQLFLQPAKESLDAEQLSRMAGFNCINENDSFDYFNYRVLQESLYVLGGELISENEEHGFSFVVPVDYSNKKSVNLL